MILETRRLILRPLTPADAETPHVDGVRIFDSREYFLDLEMQKDDDDL